MHEEFCLSADEASIAFRGCTAITSTSGKRTGIDHPKVYEFIFKWYRFKNLLRKIVFSRVIRVSAVTPSD